TKSGAGIFLISAFVTYLFIKSLNFFSFNVSGVAITPTLESFLCSTAGFRAGSSPTIIKSGYAALNSLIAALVAVLHATTIALQLYDSKCSTFSNDNFWTSSTVLIP